MKKLYAKLKLLLFVSVTYTPGRLSSWGNESALNDSRYVESTSSSPRSDRRDMDTMDRKRHRGCVVLALCVFMCTFIFPKCLFGKIGVLWTNH